MQNIRQAIFDSLFSAEIKERFINLESDSFLKKNELSTRDRGFYTALLYGVTERRITLDYQIGVLTASPASKLQDKVRILLRMGLYQIYFMDSVPVHAAVGETVEIAKKAVNPGAVKLINGVLRRASEEKELHLPEKEKDLCAYLAIKYGFQKWMVKLWMRAYGDSRAESICERLCRSAGISLRVNLLKISRANYLKMLLDNGFSAKASNICEDGIILEKGSVSALPGYNEGLFFIQDDASRLSVYALSPKPGEALLDCCACPGGKSFAAAIAMENKGEIISADIHENKLSLISAGAERLGISIITPMCADASDYRAEFESRFDRVICDVPCSGFGTIAKKPDLRFKDKGSVSALPELQLSILQNAARYVRPGGVICYSTCTLNPAENEDNVKAFLTSREDFEMLDIKTVFPTETDGFFYCTMRRKK